MTIQEIPMQLVVEASERKADLYINGDITRGFQWFGFDMGQDSDVAYQDVVEALSDLPEDVSDIYVHINSYGGEVAEGVAIYNALRTSSAKVTTVCEGFACSIASVIFMPSVSLKARFPSLSTPVPSPIRLRLILIPVFPNTHAKFGTFVYAWLFSPFALMSSSACIMSIRCGVSKSLKLWIRSPPTLFR